LGCSIHCHICEFRDLCQTKAREEDNLSLLTGLSEREIKEQHKKGIFTVTQYSYTFRPRKKSGRARNQSIPHFGALKALAIRENKIYVYEKPALSLSPVTIYWDIEGDPKQGFSYLIGLVIVSGESINHHNFWAQNEQQEEQIFYQFLQVLSSYSDYYIFHYGSYEISFLKRIKKQLGEEAKQKIDELLGKSINILSIIYTKVYFPTYSNGLKDIGKYLGFRWTHPEGSGMQSWVWRKRWEMTGDDSLKEILIQYNLEDCLALKKVTELIYQIIVNPGEVELNELRVAHAQDVKQKYDYGFHSPAFSSIDLEYINKCSYFDYQREKVFVRTNKKLREIQTHEKRKAKSVYKINKCILIQIEKCPNCGSNQLYSQKRSINKVIFDLKFSRSGIKSWILRYSTFQYQCKQCRKGFVPTHYKNIKQIYEHGLVGWCIYNYVVNRQSYEQIQRTLIDVFSISIPLTSIYDFKTAAVSYYQRTYENLLTKITSSSLMHCDETSIRLQKDKGYVWLFTNMEEAVYIYKPTREGDFLHELLKDFKGVLISDFYSAYDSIDCPQQKCIVHLIRDLNNSLFQNPFDEEFKDLVKSFTLLLREIIDCIDKYGLKRRNLNKYKGKVAVFFLQTANRKYKSELAKKFQKRFKKNIDKLFTFLDYDGVPWNNNYAEHAIKVFANYRKLVNGQVTEAGIKVCCTPNLGQVTKVD
jgi:uncharacterized protein YprB with RNaseH-like and TPR domain